MAKIMLRMPMLPRETLTPITVFRLVLSLVVPSAIEVVVDGEEDEEAEGVLAVGRLVSMITDSGADVTAIVEITRESLLML
jgi:hypothetical protein